MYLTHNIGNASAFPIIMFRAQTQQSTSITGSSTCWAKKKCSSARQCPMPWLSMSQIRDTKSQSCAAPCAWSRASYLYQPPPPPHKKMMCMQISFLITPSPWCIPVVFMKITIKLLPWLKHGKNHAGDHARIFYLSVNAFLIVWPG